MDKVSDVLVFTLRNPDYFAEFLSGDSLPDELTADEKAALNAARAHVEEAICDLLHLCGERIASDCGAAATGYYRASTRKNRTVRVKPPKGKEKRLYGIGIGVRPVSGALKLSVWLETKKESQDQIVRKLDELGVAYEKDGYFVYGSAVDINLDDPFDSLADRASGAAKLLMRAVE